MVTVNLTDTDIVGDAVMSSGDFLTFDGLPKNKFNLIIPSQPTVQFFLQSFAMPSVQVNEVKVATRVVDYNEIGEKMNFSPFTCTFLVDKYSRNWASVFNWMKEMTVDGSSVGRTDDIVLLLDGKEFIRFYGAYPLTLSGYDLDSTIQELTYVKGTVTFNYDYFSYIGTFATADSDYN